MKISFNLAMRELAHLRMNWLGVYVDVEYKNTKPNIVTLQISGASPEEYSFAAIPPAAWEGTLDDLAQYHIAPLLAAKLGERKPTLLDLLNTATEALEQLRRRLEGA